MSEPNNIENYNDRLIYLTNEVNKVVVSNNNDKSFLPKNINYTYITIISLPIVIVIILIILKPDFIKIKMNVKGKDVKKISYIRIIIITIVLYVIEFLIKFFLIDKNVLKPKTKP